MLNWSKDFLIFLKNFKVSSEEDISLARKVLLEGKNEWFTESTNFSSRFFLQSIFGYFVKDVEINLQPVHLKFIEEFL